MNKYFGRLCCFARENANLTQEQASELLNVSPRTIGAYECGEYIPPDDIVDKMVEIYNAPRLGYYYLSKVLLTGRRLLPQIDKAGVAATATQFRKSLRNLSDTSDELDDICEDDLIEEHEHCILRRCMEKCQRLAATSLNVLMMGRFLKKPDWRNLNGKS